MTPSRFPAPDGPLWVEVTDHSLDTADPHSWLATPSCGAISLFRGVVRDHSDGLTGVTGINYEAHEASATERMERIAALVFENFSEIGRVAIWHRTGLVALGESSVVCAVSASHRHQAINAMSFCIDVVKESLPIWKTEHGAGEENWPDNGTLIREPEKSAADWLAKHRPTMPAAVLQGAPS